MRRLASPLRASAPALLALASLLPAAAAAQPRLPSVAVSVEVEAPAFSRYSAASRAEVQRELEAALAESGSAHFPFVEWKAGSGPAAGQPRLRGQVVQDDGTRPFPRILLRFDAELAGQPTQLPSLQELVLYSEQDPNPPTHDPDRLARDVERLLQLRFRDAAFRDALHGDFLSRVPLADDVHVAPERRRVLVPIDWHRSRIGFDSRLRVHFKGTNPSGAQQNGTMKLWHFERSLAPPIPDGLESAVFEFSFAPIDLSNGAWDDAIAGIVANCRVEGIYMETFSRNVNRSIDGNLVTRPD